MSQGLVRSIIYMWLIVCGLHEFLPLSMAQTNDTFTIRARVYNRGQHERPVENLTKQNFRARLDNRPVEIVGVVEEKRPLALMLVFVLGVNGKCGFSSYSQLATWIGSALRNSLQLGEQVGVVITNAQGETLLRLDARREEWENVFGSEWKTGIPKIVLASEAQSIACRAVVRNGDSQNGLEFGGTIFPETISLSPRNYLSVAFKNALTELRNLRQKESRPVLLVVNDIYNVVDFSEQDEKDILNMMQADQVAINWIGKPEGLAGCCHLITDPACVDPPHKRIKFIYDLPKLSGGQTISCDIFRTENRWGRALNPQIEISQRLNYLMSSLRHYYSIKLPLQMRKSHTEKLKIDLVGSQTRGATISYPL
jgi:hypothetical protein